MDKDEDEEIKAYEKHSAKEYLMTYGWAILIILIIAGVLFYYGVIEPNTVTALEQQCKSIGGTVSTSLCCNSVSDFPNTCLVGACGCAEADSHEIKVCNCPEGECWDGTNCTIQ